MNVREHALRRTIPVWINSFNRLTYLENIVAKFEANGFRNINILDNNSEYPPLLAYYGKIAYPATGVVVLYYNQNHGPRYFHYHDVHRSLHHDIPHLYTDPDIDFDVLADNYLCRLLELSEMYKAPKVGSALEIPDPEQSKGGPDGALSIRTGQESFWIEPVADDAFHAAIDTTLHLFNPKYFVDREAFIQGIRVAGPGFTVKHLPWYKSDPMPRVEYDFYMAKDNGWASFRSA